MNISKLSKKFSVRSLHPEDVEILFALAAKNETFYRYHPPFVTIERLLEDMSALPPGKEAKDKFFIGFFEGQRMVAVMDLILDYPGSGEVWIGWFMMELDAQGKGIGTEIISDCTECLSDMGYKKIQLAIDEGNPQSSAFWTKNGFITLGNVISNDFSPYIFLKKDLTISVSQDA